MFFSKFFTIATLTLYLARTLVQIKCRATKVLKSWYGCSFLESSTLSDLYTHYSSGQLDGTDPLSEHYTNAMVKCQAGKDRKELIRVCSDISVGQVVSSVGNYIEFNLQIEESHPLNTASSKMVVEVLLQSAQNKTALPPKWNTVNSKVQLTNDIIDWQHFQGYRKPEKHKKVDAESLSRGVLTNHSTSLMFLASNSYMKSQCWSNVKQAVC